ncbi:Zn(II)2Cys6 transcription factor [Aspergillus stella-maris]|uniref:Zn(II)2Cys6 transcription factor n=1 Tax=Aspergillus stella-maris TaxID=1810926 RepID=UPI003CCDBD21
MQQSPSGGATQANPKLLGNRRHACDRCRRQKLKCDITKPCSLCVRSGFDCLTTPTPLRNSKQSQKRRTERRRSASHLPVPSTAGSPLHSERCQRPANSPQSSHGPSSYRDGNLESLPWPHRYGQVSAVELTDELFRTHNTACMVSPTETNNTSALPGGGYRHPRGPDERVHGRGIPLASHFSGLLLPSRQTCDFLLQSYFTSVHWFMMVFDKSALEKQYEDVIGQQTVTPQQHGVAVLVLMVLALGARYTSEEQGSQIGLTEHDRSRLQGNMIAQVRAHFFEILDAGGLECVQCCILLSTFDLYNGNPNMALPVLGAGIGSAQAQGLHKESLWGAASESVIEVRKRTWWALYVLDRFASITYGRPPSIDEAHCSVSMPRDMEDSQVFHPLLNSLEYLATSPPARVTLGSYQRYKFELYTIASSIIGSIYTSDSSKSDVRHQAAVINTKLVTWFEKLPAELKLKDDSEVTNNLSSTELEVYRLFALQALVLQLAYDNIQIILHRPFLRYSGQLIMEPNPHSLENQPTSFDQCKHCARRTCSILPRYAPVLLAAKNTHAVAYIAIQNFTAGVTLGMVALSDPGSVQSQDAKKGVANSISLQKDLAESSIIPSQTVKVLEGLFQLIFQQEMRAMLEGPPFDMTTGYSINPEKKFAGIAQESPIFGRINQLQSETLHAAQFPSGQHNTGVPLRFPNAGGELEGPYDEIDHDLRPYPAPLLPLYSGVDQALDSVQQVLWECSDPVTHVGNDRPTDGHSRPSAEDNAPFNSHISSIDPFPERLNDLNFSLPGQSWVWNWTTTS